MFPKKFPKSKITMPNCPLGTLFYTKMANYKHCALSFLEVEQWSERSFGRAQEKGVQTH